MNDHPELIVMLTHNDLTVENAAEVFETCKNSKAEYWGFKENSEDIHSRVQVISVRLAVFLCHFRSTSNLPLFLI